VPEIICEILGSKLGRVVTLSDAGFDQGSEMRLPGTPLPQVLDHAAALWRSEARRGWPSASRTVVSGPASVAPVFEWENPPDDFDVSSDRGHRQICRADVQAIREARARYEQMYRRVGGIPVWPRIIDFLDSRVAPLLHESYDDAIGRSLMHAAGGLVAVAGICLYDADRQAGAQSYLYHALRLAKASGDRGFGGYVVALLANQAMSLGHYRQVVQYTETAMRGASGRLSPALISDLCTLQAKAYARMGDRGRCYEQMRRSEAMAGRIQPSEEPPETGYVQRGLAEVQHAEALRHLGDLGPARSYAEEALSTAESSHLRSQAHRFATLAMVLAARGEVEEAAWAGQEMLDRLQGMESRRLGERAVAVWKAIRAQGDSIVTREFTQRAREQLTAPD
jgi:tetratricopeptide (TPR) repeat protein